MGSAVFDSTSLNRTMAFSLANVLQLDYIVTTTTPATPPDGSFFDVLSKFTSWVGRAPTLPEYFYGYWHSRNRCSKFTNYNYYIIYY